MAVGEAQVLSLVAKQIDQVLKTDEELSEAMVEAGNQEFLGEIDDF